MWPFKNKNIRNGFSFTDDRVNELNEFKKYILLEDNSDKKVLLLNDKCADSREIIAFFGLDAKNCVIYLTHSGSYIYDLNKTVIIHKDIAGVFATHEKNKKVYFADGISEYTHLYNVEVVDSRENKLSFDKKHFRLFSLPSKIKLFNIFFGKVKRYKNQNIENLLLSLKVIDKVDNIFFHLTNSASFKVRESFFNFKETFFKLKIQSTFSDKVYPSVPDAVCGGAFDFKKAYKDAEEGIIVNKFYGDVFYEIMSNEIPELQKLLDIEYERIRFIESFPGLERLLIQKAYTNGFGELGLYAYVPIDRSRYDNHSSVKLRGITEREYSFWDSFLSDLENIYLDKLPERYYSNNDQKSYAQKITKLFYEISNILISGEASNDNDIISYINLKSSKGIEKQILKDTTFTFVQFPRIDSNSNSLVKLLESTINKEVYNALEDKKIKKFISSSCYKVI